MNGRKSSARPWRPDGVCTATPWPRNIKQRSQTLSRSETQTVRISLTTYSALYDTASYFTSGGRVEVWLINGRGYAGDAFGDTLISIENLQGSGFNDLLVGDDLPNDLKGFNGNDILSGLAHNDTLWGGAGNDLLVGGTGRDHLIGGDGIDTASYATAGGNVEAWLISHRGFAGDANGDVLFEIENLIGSSFDDIFRGNNGPNDLIGGNGNDKLNGQGGDDNLSGGADNDYFVGGTGADRQNGGTGIDTASFLNAGSGVEVRLINGRGFAGDAAGDRYLGIENLFGSEFGDLLVGDNNENVMLGSAGNDALNGQSGNDLISGGAGNDRLVGHFGNDLLSGGSGNDIFIFRPGEGADRIVDFMAGAGLGDRIFIDNVGAVPNAFGDLSLAQAGANTVIDLGGGDQIILLGVNVVDLAPDDFLF